MKKPIVHHHECGSCNHHLKDSVLTTPICGVCGTPIHSSCLVSIILDADDNDEFKMLHALDPNSTNMSEAEYFSALQQYAVVNHLGHIKPEHSSYACNVCTGQKARVDDVLLAYNGINGLSPEFVADRLIKAVSNLDKPFSEYTGRNEAIEDAVNGMAEFQEDMLSVIQNQAQEIHRLKSLYEGWDKDDQ